MTKEELIKRLETTCLGLDPIDPLRLLVDDVIAALAQPQRTWVGLTDKERHDLYEAHHDKYNIPKGSPDGMDYERAIEAKVRADEREACAKVVDDIESRCIAEDVDDPPLKHVAAAIRARGEQA